MPGRRLFPIISASFLLLAILPLLFLAGAASRTIVRGLDSDLRASLSAVVNAAALETERAVKPISQSLDSLSFFLAANQDLEDVTSFMEALQRGHNSIASMAIIGAEDRILAVSPRNSSLIDLDYSGFPEISRARASSGNIISPPFIPPGSSRVVIAAYRRAGSYILSIHLDLDELSLFLRRLRLSDADHLSVADGRGRVIASTDINEVIRQRDLSPADLAVPDLSRSAIEGREHFVLVRQVLTTGWKAIYYRDTAEALQIARRFALQLGVVSFAALAAAVAAAIAIGRALSRPIAHILDEILSMAEGRYDRRIGGIWPLELQAIATSFNTMADRIQARDRELIESEERARHDLQEKIILLKEIHHRVKNNLQIIASLLHLQEQNLVDPRDVEMIQGSEDRIHSMSLTHEILYQSSDFSAIDMGEYADRVLSYLREAYRVPGLELELEAEKFRLSLEQATPLGLILNELVTNAFKYALRHDAEGRENPPRLRVRLRRLRDGEEGRELVELEVEDNGPGLPAGLDPRRATSLGMSLVLSLARQLGGSAEWLSERGELGGLRVLIAFHPSPVAPRGAS